MPKPARPTPVPLVRLQPEPLQKTPTLTPFQPIPKTPTIATTPTPASLSLWIGKGVPRQLRALIQSSATIKTTENPENAQASLDAVMPGNTLPLSRWVYALVAPFPMLVDSVSLDEIRQAWQGKKTEDFGDVPLMLSESTLEAFKPVFGEPTDNRLRIVPDDELLAAGWNNRPAWAIIPFEELQPRWKVLQVDGISPLQKEFDSQQYGLMVSFGIRKGADERLVKGLAALVPPTNLDPERLTILAFTGTTALARATAAKMDSLGVDYPGRDIAAWLHEADLIHISHEASFFDGCPKADPFSTSMLFCSDPKNIALFDHLGVNIIELTGNHLMDWGAEAMLQSLRLYQERGWTLFGGGENLADARQARTIEDHGNKLAFVGCNLAGPPNDWATDEQPGSAPCGKDYDWMVTEITKLREDGYLPIVSVQYYEDYSNKAVFTQREDFRRLVEAGAMIVSGTQAHTPKEMEFWQDGFIHYGLGNLFFDQMEVSINGVDIPQTRREFIDLHFFYNGKYISTQLLTAMLEDYARPRPMDKNERQDFLKEIFRVGGWK